MKNTFLKTVLAASFMTAAGAAQALTISVSEFDMTEYSNKTAGFTVENFDSIATGTYTNLDTSVGTFTSGGGAGSGTSCTTISGNGDCLDEFAITEVIINGQFGPTSDRFVNSIDTLGVSWDVDLDGAEFNKIVFVVADAADISPIVMTITAEADGDVTTVSAQIGPDAGNGNEKTVEVEFSSLVTGATISMTNSADSPDDAFTVDGAAVGIVPLPAAGLLLLGGLGALGAMRKLKKS